jgi:hypothetical protein
MNPVSQINQIPLRVAIGPELGSSRLILLLGGVHLSTGHISDLETKLRYLCLCCLLISECELVQNRATNRFCFKYSSRSSRAHAM